MRKYIKMVTATMIAVSLAACSENDDSVGDVTPDDSETPDVSTGAMAFALATSVTDGDKTANVLLTSNELGSGSVSPINNGLVNDGATEWVFYGDKYLYALTYNQGNAGTTRSYVLNSDGQMKARSAEYKVTRFTSFGKFGDYIISASTGDGLAEYADAHLCAEQFRHHSHKGLQLLLHPSGILKGALSIVLLLEFPHYYMFVNHCFSYCL